MPNPIDIHVGARIRARRKALGLTQEDLATALGIKFQQVQKYETGANRIAASRLWTCAQTLQVPVAHFFDGLGDEPSDTLTPATRREASLLTDYRALPEQMQHCLSDIAEHLTGQHLKDVLTGNTTGAGAT